MLAQVRNMPLSRRLLGYAVSLGLCSIVTGCDALEQLAALQEHSDLAIVGEPVKVPVASDPRNVSSLSLDTAGPSIPGYLDRPTDVPLRGAVVMLHGCQGLDTGTRLSFISWIEWWKQRGFATLVIDSHEPRNIDQACIGQDVQMQADLVIRMSDALAATNYLRETLELPANRIGLQGFSYGGQVAVTLARYDTSGFGWAVALYPGCDYLPHPHQYKPTLVFIGQADDWTGTDYCGSASDEAEFLKIIQLPHARHLFDQPLPERIAFGHRVGFDPGALTAARRQIDGFLNELETPRATNMGLTPPIIPAFFPSQR
jgi:dienelactone hydrolase